MEKSPEKNEVLTMGRADILLRFLQLIGKDRPLDIDPVIAQIDGDIEKGPLVNQIIDRLLSSNPTYYEKYVEARTEVGEKNPYSSPDDRSGGGENTSGLGRFISKWIEFERIARQIVEQKGDNVENRIQMPLQLLLRAFSFSSEQMMTLQHVSKLRNEVVHGMSYPSTEELKEASDTLDKFIEMLKRRSSILSDGKSA